MTTSVRIAKIERFSEIGVERLQNVQIVDESGLGLSEGEGKLIFQKSGSAIEDRSRLLTPYFADYDMQMNSKGFVFSREFNYYFVNKKFSTFQTNDNLFLLNTNKKTANAFLKSLSREKNGNIKAYDFKPIPIDFNKITSKVDNLTGLWAEANRANLHTQAFFGDNVNYDEEVKAILTERKASFIQFDLVLDGVVRNMGITKEGNVVFYNYSAKNPEIVMKLALEIYDTLIK